MHSATESVAYLPVVLSTGSDYEFVSIFGRAITLTGSAWWETFATWDMYEVDSSLQGSLRIPSVLSHDIPCLAGSRTTEARASPQIRFMQDSGPKRVLGNKPRLVIKLSHLGFPLGQGTPREVRG